MLYVYVVGEVSFVELFEDEYGKPRGSGIVEFEKLEHARIALEKMNRFELKGRRLIVKEVRIPYDLHSSVFNHEACVSWELVLSSVFVFSLNALRTRMLMSNEVQMLLQAVTKKVETTYLRHTRRVVSMVVMLATVREGKMVLEEEEAVLER